MALVITGMHRSGTSAVARLVDGVGLKFGHGELAETVPENPRGFFERVDVAEFNDEWLARLGGSWDAPPRSGPVDFARLSDRLFHDARPKLDLLSADAKNWYVKDPRISLILPVWDRLCLRTVPTIFVVRSPREVAHSLRLRNSFSARLSLSLWLSYTNAVLQAATFRDVLVIDYDRMLLEPSATAESVQSFTARVNDSPLPTVDAAKLTALLQPDLRRQQEQDLDRFGEFMIEDLAEFHQELSKMNGQELSDRVAPLPVPDWADEALDEASELWRAKADVKVKLARHERDAMERDLAALQDQLAEAEVALAGVTASRSYRYGMRTKAFLKSANTRATRWSRRAGSPQVDGH